MAKTVNDYFQEAAQKIGEEFKRELGKNRSFKNIDKKVDGLTASYQYTVNGYFVNITINIGTDGLRTNIFVQGGKYPKGKTVELVYKNDVTLDKVANHLSRYMNRFFESKEPKKEKTKASIKKLYIKDPKLAIEVANTLGYDVKVNSTLISLNYGELPPISQFKKQYEKSMEGEKLYNYNLKGEDAKTASRVGIPKSGNFNVSKLYKIVEKLKNAWDTGDDEAGDLASSIMYTLDFEWV